MGTIAEKLTYLNTTKSDIRDSIIAKGVDVPTETTFREYATKIEDINDATTTLEFVERVNENGGTVTNLNNVLEELNNVTDESLLMIPSGRKEGVLYSQLPTDGSGDFTVNRNSPVWIENSEGVLVEVPANVPVFDKNGNLVVQGQSTNIIPYSEDFSNDIWTESLSSVQNYSGKVYKLIPNSGTNVSRLLYNNIIVENGKDYVFSIYVKGNDFDYFFFRENIDNNSLTNTFFDIKNGTVESVGSGKIASIKSVGNDWHKVSISGHTETTEIIYFGFGFCDSATNNNVTSDGSQYGLIKQSQFEKGTEPSTTIPTNGTAETRLADEITVTPPSGTTEITETVNGVENTITTIPVTYQISEGLISKIVMK